MDDCTITSRIGAYHDGELDAQARRSVEQHLAGCEDCRAELAHLRKMSALLGAAPVDRLTDDEMAAFRDQAEGLADRPPLHLFGGMMAAAASILIVCGAWWHAIPKPAPAAPAYATHPAEAWERVAMNLRVEPLASPREATAVADAQLADWMLAGL